MYNKDRFLDALFHSGIISLRVDSSGVNSNDNSIVESMGLSFDQLEPYLSEGTTPQISSFTTDAGGGRY